MATAAVHQMANGLQSLKLTSDNQTTSKDNTFATGLDDLNLKITTVRDKILADFVTKNPKSKAAYDEACTVFPVSSIICEYTFAGDRILTKSGRKHTYNTLFCSVPTVLCQRPWHFA
jgi:hypothetical protein